MRTRLVAPLAVVVLTMAACSSSTSAKAQTVSVQVDGKTDAYNGSFTAYFPNTIQVHAGDTVQFKSVFTGEPHTVTMGKLVDTGLPKADPNSDTEPPELQKIPLLVPNGPGDANQGAAQPCFLATGAPPADGSACTAAQHTQPEFDGTQAYYNSGFLSDGQVYSVTISKNTKAGTYNYFCALHREAMTGKIVVVKNSTKIATPAQVTTNGQTELSQTADKLKAAETALQTGSIPTLVNAKQNQVIAGSGDPNVGNAQINEFGPSNLSIPVGGAVTWVVLGPHTISFNAPASAQVILAKSPDGSAHVNPQAAAPAGGPGQPPPSNASPPANGPPPAPAITDGGSWDGTGFHSSGLFLSFPPALSGYKLTFTKAGSYAYQCLVHAGMKGTIKVG